MTDATFAIGLELVGLAAVMLTLWAMSMIAAFGLGGLCMVLLQTFARWRDIEEARERRSHTNTYGPEVPPEALGVLGSLLSHPQGLPSPAPLPLQTFPGGPMATVQHPVGYGPTGTHPGAPIRQATVNTPVSGPVTPHAAPHVVPPGLTPYRPAPTAVPASRTQAPGAVYDRSQGSAPILDEEPIEAIGEEDEADPEGATEAWPPPPLVASEVFDVAPEEDPFEGTGDPDTVLREDPRERLRRSLVEGAEDYP